MLSSTTSRPSPARNGSGSPVEARPTCKVLSEVRQVDRSERLREPRRSETLGRIEHEHDARASERLREPRKSETPR